MNNNLSNMFKSYETVQDNVQRDFYLDLYDKILLKKEWGNDTNSLKNYIGAMTSRVAYLYNLDREYISSPYYTLNEDKSRILINTSLLDKFGNDIFVVFKLRDGELDCPYFVDSKSYLSKLGFSKQAILRPIESVRFYNDVKETIFSGSFEEFDLNNPRRLEHIIVERISRFPKNVQNLSESALCDKLIQAIRFGVRMSKRDSRFIVPMYSIPKAEIQFMFPFHVNNAITESPELAIIVGKKDDFYSVMTIITLEEAESNKRTISPYSDRWINK